MDCAQTPQWALTTGMVLFTLKLAHLEENVMQDVAPQTELV